MSRDSFRNVNYVPPGGRWFYTVEQSGRYFESLSSMRELAWNVLDHLAVNGFPKPDSVDAMILEIQDHMCKRLPRGFCNNPDAGVPGIDFFSVQKATELLVRRVREPDFFVDVMEADRRAGVCRDCSLNLKHMCTTCNGLKQLFGKLVSQRRTKHDDQLGVCAACGCGLQAKVQVNLKYLDTPPDMLEKLPVFCWLKGTGTK